jgi:hypothetical protein
MGPNRRLAVPLLVSFFFVPALAAAQAPGSAPSVGLVSPGGPGAPTLTTVCPTFSWAPGDFVAEYELAVFELAADGKPNTVPSLHVAVSGRASSWTPPATSCLSPGQRYGWYMREIQQAGSKPGKWSDALAFAVTAAASATGGTNKAGASGAAKAGVNAAGNGNGPANPNQEILDRLTTIETQLTSLLNPPAVKKETCLEWGVEGEGGVDAEGKAHLEADASAGAKGFGNGIKAAIAAKAEVKLAGALKGSLGIKRSRCWTPLILGGTPSSAVAAASVSALDEVSDAQFIAGLESLAAQLQLGEDRIGAALNVLPTFAVGAEPWSALRTDGTIARLAENLPLPESIRTTLSDPAQIIANFRAQMNLCAQTNLPPAVAGLIGEFCQLAAGERFGPLLDRVEGLAQGIKGGVDGTRTVVNGINGVVTTINGKVTAIQNEVNAVYCRFFCGPN